MSRQSCVRSSKRINDEVFAILTGVHGKKWSVDFVKKGICFLQIVYPNRVTAQKAFKNL